MEKSTAENTEKIDKNAEDVSHLKEDLGKTDDTTRILFLGKNIGWRGTSIGDKIQTDTFTGLKGVSLLTALNGDVFFLNTISLGGWAKAYFILDTNYTIIEMGNYSYNGVLVINNESARYLAVNTTEAYINDFVLYLNTKLHTGLNENTNKINKVIDDIADIKTEFTIKADVIYEKDKNITNANSGLFNINTKGIDFQTSDFYKYTTIENTKFGDVYYCSGTSHNDGSSYPFVVFADSNDNILSTIKSEITDYKYTDYKIIVADDKCSKIYVNGSSLVLSAFTSKKIDFNYLNSLMIENRLNLNNNTWLDANVQNAIIDEQKKNPFAWGALDKGTIVFTFDDSLNDIDLVESISEEYGIPVCFSIVPENMNNITTATGDNKKVKEVLTEAVKHGNEVLCHSQIALSSESTDEEVYAQFVTNKKELESYGFTIRGIIEAGSGGNENTFDYKRAERYLRLLYNYSDKYGKGLGLPNFYNPRTYISRNPETNHTYVDNCVKNKTILIFVTHLITDSGTSTGNTSEDILRDLMLYVKTKDVHLLTFGGVYDKFRSSNLENIIKTLK